MANGDFTCVEHTGCIARIDNLERTNHEQWGKIGKLNDRLDSIFTRINITLGGIAVACILLVVNLIIK